MRMEFLKRASALCMLAIATLLPGCGGGDQASVEYSGTTLFVDGTPYERRTLSEINVPGDWYQAGIVYVTEQPGQRTIVEARLNELELAHQRDESISSFKVEVPIDWEDQWARALRIQPQVLDAWLNFAISLDAGEIIDFKPFAAAPHRGTHR